MKIDHINIVVENLESARDFFLDLGFEIKTSGKLEGEWIDKIVNLSDVNAEYIALSLPGHETNLELLKFNNPQDKTSQTKSKANQFGYRHMALEVKNIESVVKTLKDKGVRFYSDIQIYNKKKKLCYFEGPEGIILELAEYKK